MVSVDGLTLYTGDESNVAAEGNLDVTSTPAQSAGQTFITSLYRSEQSTVSGQVDGLTLRQNGYPDDVASTPGTVYPNDDDGRLTLRAVCEWIQEFESLCNTTQGNGVTIQDDERDRSITAAVTGLNWRMDAGNPFAVRWSLDAVRGDVIFPTGTRSPTAAGPNASTTLGGTDLGTVRQKRTEVSIGVQVDPKAFQDPATAVIQPDSGQQRVFTLSGQKHDTQANLRSFSNTMRTNIGSNQQFTYVSGIPGVEYETVVADYDDTWNAGVNGLIDYSLTLREGLVF